MGLFDRFKKKKEPEEPNLLISAEKVAKYGEEADVKDWEKKVDEGLKRKQLTERRRIWKEDIEAAKEEAERAEKGEKFIETINKSAEEQRGAAREAQIAREYKGEEEKALRTEREAEELQSKAYIEKEEKKRALRIAAGAEDREREIEKKEEEGKKKELGEARRGGEVPEGYTRCSNPFCSGKYGPEVYPITETRCPVCLTPNRELQLKPGKTVCPYCHKITDINEPKCIHCGEVNKAYVSTKSLGEATASEIKGRLYEILMYIIAGIAVIFIPPFFGLPSFRFLGIALMAFMPFYTLLPSESAVRRSIKVGEEGIPPGKVGLLVTKAMAKLLIFFFVAYLELFPLNRLIALIFTFFFYFTMPTSYKESQPYRLIEAWARPVVVGVYLSFLILMTFAGSYGFANAGPGASLFFMSIAFFVWSFPTHKQEREEGVMKLVVSTKLRDLSQTHGFIAVERYIFFTFMLFAIGMSGLNLMNIFSPTGTTELTFFAVWFLSLLSGLLSAPESRPYIGAFMIFIAIFTFTFTYTGVMGQAVFGYWWPQVESFGEAVFEPLGPIWEQVQGGMGDAWLILTNPMGYYDIMQKRQQAVKSVVKEGGTTKSIELTKKDLFTSVTGELEPRLDPLIGSFEIQNQGEFDASTINLTLWTTWKDPEKLTDSETGKLKTISCSQPYARSEIINSPLGTNRIGICTWSETTYPQEIKVVNFMFEQDKWCIGSDTLCTDNLNNCTNYDKTPLDCNDTSGNATYEHGGQALKVNVNLTYDYNVNVSIPIEVINQEKYRDLLQARQITLQELTSQYTGGPVKATLWSQKQPVRSGELSLFVASIVNEGGGTLNNVISFKIYIPDELVEQNNIELIAQTFKKASQSDNEEPKGCGDFSVNPHPTNSITIDNKKYWLIECEHGKPMSTGEYKRVSFFITPKDVIDRRTGLIVGLANYEYIKTGSTSITIANAPWH
jgi:hypothetical protein